MSKRLSVRIDADTSGFQKSIKGMQDSMKSATSGVSKSTKGITSGFKDILGSVGKIAGAVGVFKLVSAGMNLVTNSIDGAISRVDTLNQFPKVLQQMGYGADEAERSTSRLSEGIQGLPTTLDGIVGSTQRLVTIFGDVDLATESALALNNAFLASGASQADASRGLEQYTQMLSAGKVDMQSWRTLQETMPYALNKTAEAFGYTGKSAQNDFYKALQDGEITFDDFNAKLIELSNETGGFAEVALEASKGIRTSWTNVKTAITNGVAGIITAFDDWLDSEGFGGIAGVLDVIKVKVQEAFRAIGEWVPRALEWFTELYNKISDSSAFQLFKDTVTDAFNSVRDAINDIDFEKLISDIGEFLDKWSPLIAGILGAVAAFKVIMSVISLVSGVMTVLTGLSATLGVSIGAIMWPVVAVAAAIGALIAIGVALYKNWDEISAKASEIWGAITDFFAETWNSITESVSEAWGAITEFFSTTWENIRTSTSEAWNGIKETLTELWSSLVESVNEFFTPMVEFFAELWEQIKANVQEAWEGIKDIVETILTILLVIFVTIWNVIADVINTTSEIITGVLSTAWEFITDITTTAFEGLKSFFSSIWESIKEVFTTVATAIKNFLAPIWESISSTVSSVFNKVKNFFSDTWNAIKNKTTEVWEGIKTWLSGIWNGIKTQATSIFDSIKNKVSEIWNSVKAKTSEVWNSIKSTIDNIWTGIKSGVSGAVESVKTTVTNTFNSVKSTVTSIWNSIKSAITTPINSAVDAVRTAINKIKGFMNFSWSLPKLKMPSVSISGKFSLAPPSVPKFGLSWHQSGGIFKGSKDGTIVGLGENHGDEAIVPLSNKSRMAPFAQAVASMMPKDDRDGGSNGKGGDTIITGNTFVVREEADIKKVAQELKRLDDRESRARGRKT